MNAIGKYTWPQANRGATCFRRRKLQAAHVFLHPMIEASHPLRFARSAACAPGMDLSGESIFFSLRALLGLQHEPAPDGRFAGGAGHLAGCMRIPRETGRERPGIGGRGSRPEGGSGFGGAKRGDRTGAGTKNPMNARACAGFPHAGRQSERPRIAHDNYCYRAQFVNNPFC